MIETILAFKYLLMAFVLIFLDKAITVLTIKTVERNYPKKDKFSVEKNPLALYFFKRFGLAFGSIFYGIFSVFSFFFSVYLLNFIFSYKISFLIIAVIYGLVIINNIKWCIKFSRC